MLFPYLALSYRCICFYEVLNSIYFLSWLLNSRSKMCSGSKPLIYHVCRYRYLVSDACWNFIYFSCVVRHYQNSDHFLTMPCVTKKTYFCINTSAAIILLNIASFRCRNLLYIACWSLSVKDIFGVEHRLQICLLLASTFTRNNRGRFLVQGNYMLHYIIHTCLCILCSY